MANLNESATWETGIFQIETTTPALGGPDGPVNTAPRQLANRTQYLKQQTDKLNAIVTAAAGNAESMDGKSAVLCGGQGCKLRRRNPYRLGGNRPAVHCLPAHARQCEAVVGTGGDKGGFLLCRVVHVGRTRL